MVVIAENCEVNVFSPVNVWFPLNKQIFAVSVRSPEAIDISAEPLNDCPAILRAVCNITAWLAVVDVVLDVAVVAVVADVADVAVVAVAAFPEISPCIVLEKVFTPESV